MFALSQFEHFPNLDLGATEHCLHYHPRMYGECHQRTSSAHNLKIWKFGSSLMYNRNSSSPKMVPWGTPQLNEQLLESDPLMEHI